MLPESYSCNILSIDPHQQQYNATIEEMMKRIKKGQVKLRSINDEPVKKNEGSSKGPQAVQELDNILVCTHAIKCLNLNNSPIKNQCLERW